MKKVVCLVSVLAALIWASAAAAVGCPNHASSNYIYKGMTYCYTSCTIPNMNSTSIAYTRSASGQSWSTYSRAGDHAAVWFEVVSNSGVGNWLQAGIYVGNICSHVASDQPHLYVEWFVGTSSATCADPNYGFIDYGPAGVGTNHSIRYDWEGGNTWQVAVDGTVRAIKTFQTGPANDVEEMTEDQDFDNICDSVDATLGPYTTTNGTTGWPWVFENPNAANLIVGPGQFAPDSVNPFEIDWNDRGAVQATYTQHWLPGFGATPGKSSGYVKRTPGLPAVPGEPDGWLSKHNGQITVNPFAPVMAYGSGL